ncbi:zf-HC2 domain-containing protein [Spirillospora sp. NPDC029432]|uniref:anti-sigma factor family protein n=1 Tax=Spirillospora sp. NPDC029432 TaxID=3154599 RepID=UPI003452F1E5
MSCLGERLTALVDGELGHEERDRALAHLALCERCRSEADALRSLKGRLRGLGGLPASDGADDLPTPDFMARLRGMGAPGGPAAGPDDPPPPARPARSRVPAGPVPVRPAGAAPRPAASRPRDNRPAGRAARPGGRGAGATAVLYRPSRRYLAVGAATLVLGLGAASYAAGGQREIPTVTPAFDRFAVEHALTSGDVPMTEPVDDRTSVPPAPGP